MKNKEEKMAKQIKQLMSEHDIDDVDSLQSVLKSMLKSGVETLLDSELEDELGYPKSDNKVKKNNYRNGSYNKSVKSDLGEINISVPRDRNGEYEPEVVPKYSSDISAIEDKVISMYAKGMTTRDISSHIEDIYEIPLSSQSISRMTDKILPLVEEWQNRRLDEEYPFIFMCKG